LLLALLAWWLLRKRSEKAAQRFDEQERASKGEFRMADGSAPLVTPFVVPVRSPNYSDDASPASAHEYSKSSSMRDYGYQTAITPIHTSVPIMHPVYSQTTASPTSPASQIDYATYPTDTSPYESYHPSQHSYHPTATSSTVDGLANPEEFAYRDATWSSANSGPTLPPGAQRSALHQNMYD
jgi:FtsZ-interacting cell division protein ZipA